MVPEPTAAATSPPSSVSPALEVVDLGKSFGPTCALHGLTLSVNRGEIHALLGHNGSGKSTLVKILSGYHEPDEGIVRIAGAKVMYPTTRVVLHRHGLGVLHQDIGLVQDATVLENLRLTQFSTGRLRNIRWRHERKVVSDLLREWGMATSPDARVSSLSPAQRAILGLVRVVEDIKGRASGLLVLDEATASLSSHDAAIVLDAVNEVARRGMGVVFVTHHITEALALADRVSVLRDGMLVRTSPAKDLGEDELAAVIIGSTQAPKAQGERRARARGDVVLRVRDLAGRIADGVDLDVREGEILGLTGVVGSGHEEVPYLLYGASERARGEIELGGIRCRRLSPADARRHGIAFVSGDRARAGGVLAATVKENVSATALKTVRSRLGWIRDDDERAMVEQVLTRYGIRPRLPDLPFAGLSGGNQQKALIGRWMVQRPRVLLLDEPTAGVDIAAVAQIFAALDDYVANGGAVVLSSNQFEDIARVSQRVLIFQSGAIVDELSGEGVTAHTLMTRSYARASSSLVAPRSASERQATTAGPG